MTPRASLSFLRLLCNLRWLAVLGQAVTVGLVVGVMHIPLQTPPLWAGIAALAWTMLRLRRLLSQTFG